MEDGGWLKLGVAVVRVMELSKKLRSIAERRGISSETLLNLWVQEKAGEEANRV